MELTKVKVDAPGKGRPAASIEQIRAKAHVSVTNVEGGVRVRITRNLVPVAQFVAKGSTTEQRDEIIALVRKEYLNSGKLDNELRSYRVIDKARQAERKAAAKK